MQPGRPIRVGGLPYAIAMTPNGKAAYVVNDRSGTVTPIDTAANAAGRPIRVGGGSQDIAISRPDLITDHRRAALAPLTPIRVTVMA
jgi:YVTN family beta-propeller protein